jgi:hypothetical protein
MNELVNNPHQSLVGVSGLHRAVDIELMVEAEVELIVLLRTALPNHQVVPGVHAGLKVTQKLE